MYSTFILLSILKAFPSFPDSGRYRVGKYCTGCIGVTLLLVDANRWVAMDTSFCPDIPFLPPPMLRHQLPSSSIVQELNVVSFFSLANHTLRVDAGKHGTRLGM